MGSALLCYPSGADLKLYLQGILFTRAQNYASRRGFSDDKERQAIVDGWLAGYRSGKRFDSRIDDLLKQEPTKGELLPEKTWSEK